VSESRVAVVGAGPAGCGAAYALRGTDRAVTVVEARDRPGGRMRTARRDGTVYDYGANYVKPDDDAVTELLTGPLSAGLVAVEGDVWTFSTDGTIAPGREGDPRKWTYRTGIRTLADRLLDRADATVATGSTVTRLDREGAGWRLHREGGRRTEVDDVVLAVPPSALAHLLGDGDWRDADPLRADLAAAASAADYRPVVTAVLQYPFVLDRPWYGLVNTDREHDVGWLSREECKPGHVPDGESVLIVQLSPDCSRRRLDQPDGVVATAAAALAADLLGDDRLAEPRWSDVRRFRHALPEETAPKGLRERAADRGLHLAGDWLVGEGRVHLALRSGLDAGERVAGGG